VNCCPFNLLTGYLSILYSLLFSNNKFLVTLKTEQILLLQPKGRMVGSNAGLYYCFHIYSLNDVNGPKVSYQRSVLRGDLTCGLYPTCRGCGERGIAVNLPGSYIGHEAAVTDLQAKGTGTRSPTKDNRKDVDDMSYFSFERWLFSIRFFVVTLLHCYNTQFYSHPNLSLAACPVLPWSLPPKRKGILCASMQS
jgi:hypothetical protein